MKYMIQRVSGMGKVVRLGDKCGWLGELLCYINKFDDYEFGKGRYLYDVRTEGGGGVVTQYMTNTTDRLREMQTKGRGQKIPKFVWTSFKYRPQSRSRGRYPPLCSS